MGEARRRGTRAERIAAAQPKAPKPPRQYRHMLALRTPALDYLFNQMRVGPNGETILELRSALAAAVAKETAP